MFFQDKYTFKNIVLKTNQLSGLYQFYVEKMVNAALRPLLKGQPGTSTLNYEFFFFRNDSTEAHFFDIKLVKR
jgi:hypothetical protein